MFLLNFHFGCLSILEYCRFQATDKLLFNKFIQAKIIFNTFVLNTIIIDDMEDINRIKVVLVEKKKTGKWLAEQLHKDPSTVSKWCSNASQPDLATLTKIAELLNMDRRELINKSK